MATLTMVLGVLLSMFSPIHLIVGLINPNIAFLLLREKATRPEAVLLSLGLFILSLSISIPSIEIVEKQEQAQQKQEKLEADKKQQQLKQEESAKQEALEKEKQRQLSSYGITYNDFNETCSALIEANSGSNDFGVFNDTGVQEKYGSLFLQRSVYGKNAYGTKVEHRYKCWTEGSSGNIQIENIGVNFH